MPPDQQYVDRAREWVAENNPTLEGAAFDAAVLEAAREIRELDTAAEQGRLRSHVFR